MNDRSAPFYALPLRLDLILRNRQHPLCTLRESIAQNLYLLLTTGFKELRFDHSYGCVIWEQDFEILGNIKWKDTLSASLEQTIAKHESRLQQARVRIDIEEFKFSDRKEIRIKKKLVVRVNGIIGMTHEAFDFAEEVFIAPFSLD